MQAESNMRRFVLRAGLAGCLAALGGCGFHLRGSRPLPFETLYITGRQYSELNATLKRSIEAQTETTVTENEKEAGATLEILKNSRDKSILSVGGDGRVREYLLKHTLSFRVLANGGGELMPPSTVEATRELLYASDAEQLARTQEETVLYKDMLNDIVLQVLRRLQAIKRKG